MEKSDVETLKKIGYALLIPLIVGFLISTIVYSNYTGGGLIIVALLVVIFIFFFNKPTI